METLGAESVRQVGLFSPEAIQSVLDRHMSRKVNLGYHIWGLLTLHLWVKRWNIETLGGVGTLQDTALASTEFQ
jgi:asparagine synthase (glutamine-hydrolysing)